VKAVAVIALDHSQLARGPARVSFLRPGAYVPGDADNVLHHRGGILEDGMIYSLEYVSDSMLVLLSGQDVRVVNMAAWQGLHLNQLAGDAKLLCD
jgi:hypothetical protein